MRKTLVTSLAVLTQVAAVTLTAQSHSEWVEDTFLENHLFFTTEEFHQLRRQLSNQWYDYDDDAAIAEFRARDLRGAIGWIVARHNKRESGVAVYGVAALLGTDTLGRTASRVFNKEDKDTGSRVVAYTDDGRFYFVSALVEDHTDERYWVELDMNSVEYGATDWYSKGDRFDWAQFKLKERVSEKVAPLGIARNIWALLWSFEMTHDRFQNSQIQEASNYIHHSGIYSFGPGGACSPTDTYHPSDAYEPGQEKGILFLECPLDSVSPGSYGSPVSMSRRGVRYFGMHLSDDGREEITDENGEKVQVKTEPSAFLALTPESKRSLNRLFLKELRSDRFDFYLDYNTKLESAKVAIPDIPD